MGLLGNFFKPTWWTGMTFGTALFTQRHGSEVGRDEAGNVYYQHKKNPARRWVVYNGSTDASRTPPAWYAWLRGTIDELPEKALPPRRPFQIPPEPNRTGTDEAWRPSGSLSRGEQRPATTGDYQAWIPD
ncbi:NADH:ubiquinone oxidoreductase subunit NDUFA12 [Sphingomonas ginkgonis]|uniref:NADH:ubiquinone oxidoreductase subunit NDUFA12 n=1 Tax=Sphingomonas ginkgonis TaxID=2315330 RepID=A0A429V8G6_9SPHN|nr:NADH:ubiquinone oxidoreductase subunit NDUFA12 [Sphingomonas ginkgonis]RST30273.1 NADH:ubiquinone oxidoreductase subunit NDUFA12 [Sphingomonas ginkgonis]